jgi:hypothetical protein
LAFAVFVADGFVAVVVAVGEAFVFVAGVIAVFGEVDVADFLAVLVVLTDGLRTSSGAVGFAKVLEVVAAVFVVVVFDAAVLVAPFAAVEPAVGLGVADVLAEGGLRDLVNGVLELLAVLVERATGGFDNVGAFDLPNDELRVRVGLTDVAVVVAVDFLTVPDLELVVDFAILLVAALVFFTDFSFSFSFSSVGLFGGVKTPLDTDFVSVVLDSPDTDTFSC